MYAVTVDEKRAARLPSALCFAQTSRVTLVSFTAKHSLTLSIRCVTLQAYNTAQCYVVFVCVKIESSLTLHSVVLWASALLRPRVSCMCCVWTRTLTSPYKRRAISDGKKFHTICSEDSGSPRHNLIIAARIWLALFQCSLI